MIVSYKRGITRYFPAADVRMQVQGYVGPCLIWGGTCARMHALIGCQMCIAELDTELVHLLRYVRTFFFF
jgi:hypothetical protein